MNNGWLPIESAPRDGTRVVLWSAKYGTEVGWFAEWDDFTIGKQETSGWAMNWNSEFGHPDEEVISPTHWQPLPEPPVSECAAPESSEVELLKSCVALVQAMRRYEVDVDADAPFHHRDMMDKAEAAILRAQRT